MREERERERERERQGKRGKNEHKTRAEMTFFISSLALSKERSSLTSYSVISPT